MRPLRVFLCHASQDKPAVRELYNALKAEGWIDPWLDKAKILPGQDWRVVIEKAVEASDVVVACLSCQSVSKEGFVQREIKYACDMALEKPEETIFLIPLRLEDCVVPRGLRSLQWADYFGSGKEDTYNDLLEALRLRYDQKMELEAEESERQQAEEVARREAREFARKVAAEKAVREEMEREAAELAAREKREREAKRKIAREAKPAPVERIAVSYPKSNPTYDAPRVEPRKEKPVPKPEQKKPAGNSLPIAFGGLGLLLIVGLLIAGIVMTAKWLSPTPTQAPVVTDAPTDLPVATEPPTAVQAPTEAPAATEAPVTENMTGMDGMNLLYVPAGEFTMGSNADDALAECQKYRSDCSRDWFTSEEPPHTVMLDAFWIDETEVTNKMYSLCVAAGKCKEPSNISSQTHPSYYGNSEFEDYPVIYVDWNMSKTYCEWAERRLPTEAEWEKAARGPNANIYPWGNTFDGALVNFCDKNCSYDWANKSFDDGYADVSPVGDYPSGNFYGAYDMAGNVWEWVNDWYDVYPGGDASVSSDFGQRYRVLRGGSWDDLNDNVRSAYRNVFDPTSSYYNFGFRCSRSQ